jgi:hypothetical protein
MATFAAPLIEQTARKLESEGATGEFKNAHEDLQTLERQLESLSVILTGFANGEIDPS